VFGSDPPGFVDRSKTTLQRMFRHNDFGSYLLENRQPPWLTT
jgi:hypothetical protein